MDIHVLIHHHHLLDVVVAGEGAHHDVLCLALAALPHLHCQVVAHDAAAAEMHVQHVGEAALQVRQHRGFARDAAEQQVFQPAADDGVEDGRLARGDAVHLDDVAPGAFAVVLRELAEGAFLLAGFAQDAAFDDDLGLGRHADIVGQALHDWHRRAVQGAGDLQLIGIQRRDGLAGQQRDGVDADDDGDFQVLAHFLRHVQVAHGVARQDEHAQAVRAVHLQTVDGDVLDAVLRVAAEAEAGADIGAAVEFVVRGDRQQLHQVDAVAVDHLLRRRILHFPAGQRVGGGVLEAAEQAGRRDAHGLGHPAAVAGEAGDDGDGVATGMGEEAGLASVQPVGDGGDLMHQAGAGAGDGQAVRGRQPVQPVAQRGDRRHGRFLVPFPLGATLHAARD